MLVRPTLLPIDHWTEPDRGFATMRVTSPYGMRPGGFHAAIDIGNARLGDVIVSAGKGEVIARGYIGQPWTDPKPSDSWWWSLLEDPPRSGKRGGLYGPPSQWEGPSWGGQMVVIRSGEYYLSYAHMQTITVVAGQKVNAFQQIGTVGDSGSAYRQGHLHFGIRRGDTWVDPWPLISQTAQLPDTAIPTEDDVQIKGKFLRHVSNRRTTLNVNAKFRAGVIEGDMDEITVFGKGTAALPIVVVEGLSVGGSSEWYGAIMWVDNAMQFGYFHSSVLNPLEPFESADCSAVESKLATAEQTIATLKTKISAAVAALK